MLVNNGKDQIVVTVQQVLILKQGWNGMKGTNGMYGTNVAIGNGNDSTDSIGYCFIRYREFPGPGTIKGVSLTFFADPVTSDRSDVNT